MVRSPQNAPLSGGFHFGSGVDLPAVNLMNPGWRGSCHVRSDLGQSTAAWRPRPYSASWEVAVQTGLRNSELTQLQRQDVQFGTGAHVRCLGKGRKARCTPLLRSEVATRLAHWLSQLPPEPTTPVFPTARGKPMSSDAFQRLVARHIKSAGKTCPSLRRKKVSPHTLRHTTAMDLLHRGVDITVIALWLGHESIHGNATSCVRCVR